MKATHPKFQIGKQSLVLKKAGKPVRAERSDVGGWVADFMAHFIQPASRSPPGQVWKQYFYHFGYLFESIIIPWGTFGGLEMQLSGPKTDFGAQGAP